MEFELKHGLPFGKDADAEMQYRVELRELTAGDIIEAEEASEKLMLGPNGPVLVSSPARMGTELLRRQVKRVGKLQGLSLGQLKSLHPDDLELLNAQVVARDALLAREIADRGRADGAPGDH
ncbi:hypothetical protein AN401_11745 [Zobellella denitrificans]|uniref:Mu-like prophage FluMu protein gp41 n=1 Tax=Zobellella denitrificans TaxID=347534 RepID=A0A291HQN2_9GAMM|nr:phage tail assembly protein [Zobellella denitrificans]ATG74326.1 hypothetical protein AN401_11015 [Zobellella denitrificans]ATG74444.1 hypothetical protein AN401_11745 [Zobellella denitrificans]